MHRSGERLRFGLVVHGPEALDTGMAQRLMRFLEGKGEVKASMSGFTGVTAVVDAGLESVIDISMHHRPSETLPQMDPKCDFLIIVNSAKSRETALKFGSIVYSRVKDKITKPLVQVDNGILIEWNGEGAKLAEEIAQHMGCEIIPSPAIEAQQRSGRWRRISGVMPGENVWVNGVVVGKATSARVSIGADEHGQIIAEGIELKRHGVEHLGAFDPEDAHVRSGVTRRTKSKPRTITGARRGVHFVDHNAEAAAYRCRDAAVVITVGDDTSRSAGNILYRFGVPIVAIVDGDEDGICTEKLLTPGSVVMQMRPGTDDMVGAEVKADIAVKCHKDGDAPALEAIVQRVREIAGDRLLSVSTSAQGDRASS